jgi:DNA-binding NarL/FixJ family response regulator
VQTLELDHRFDVVGVGRDGIEAIDLVAATAPDIVLLDLEMPWMHGAEAVPHLRTVCPSCSIVLWTVAPESARAESALTLGATTILDKADRGIFGLPNALIEVMQPASMSAGE